MNHVSKLAVIESENCRRLSKQDILAEFFELSFFSSRDRIPPTEMFDVHLFCCPDADVARKCLPYVQELLQDCELVNVWIDTESPVESKSFFEVGVSDLLVGDISPWELRCRAKLWLKAAGSSRRFRGLKIDQHQLMVYGPNGRSVKLTHKEIQILSTFLMSRNSTVSRNAILDFVWKGVVVGKKTLDVHIFNLRKKLGQVGIEIRFLPPNNFELIVPSASKVSVKTSAYEDMQSI